MTLNNYKVQKIINDIVYNVSIIFVIPFFGQEIPDFLSYCDPLDKISRRGQFVVLVTKLSTAIGPKQLSINTGNTNFNRSSPAEVVGDLFWCCTGMSPRGRKV